MTFTHTAFLAAIQLRLCDEALSGRTADALAAADVIPADGTLTDQPIDLERAVASLIAAAQPGTLTHGEATPSYDLAAVQLTSGAGVQAFGPSQLASHPLLHTWAVENVADVCAALVEGGAKGGPMLAPAPKVAFHKAGGRWATVELRWPDLAVEAALYFGSLDTVLAAQLEPNPPFGERVTISGAGLYAMGAVAAILSVPGEPGSEAEGLQAEFAKLQAPHAELH